MDILALNETKLRERDELGCESRIFISVCTEKTREERVGFWKF